VIAATGEQSRCYEHDLRIIDHQVSNLPRRRSVCAPSCRPRVARRFPTAWLSIHIRLAGIDADDEPRTQFAVHLYPRFRPNPLPPWPHRRPASVPYRQSVLCPSRWYNSSAMCAQTGASNTPTVTSARRAVRPPLRTTLRYSINAAIAVYIRDWDLLGDLPDRLVQLFLDDRSGAPSCASSTLCHNGPGIREGRRS